MNVNSKPKVCVIVATPLTIHFFFRQHISKLSAWADVTIIFNKDLNLEIDLDDLPCKKVHLKIMRTISLWSDWLALLALLRVFQQSRFDMVISLVPKAGLLGMICGWIVGVPARLHIFQGEVWASRKGLMRYILKAADRITALLSTDLLAVSASESAFLQDQIKATKGKIKVLGAGSICGVDLKRFSADSKQSEKYKKALNIPKNAIVGLFLGRLTREKGVFELLKAYSILANEYTHFYLIVAGPDEEDITADLVAIAGEIGRDRLILAGYSALPERLLCVADFLCLLSHREGFGMVAIEAASFSIPALGTKIHGIEDAISNNKTGILVPVGDVSATVTALRQLISDNNLRNRLGAEARKRVQRLFDQENVVTDYDAAFVKILADRSF